LDELDNLLAMLSDTQQKAPNEGQPPSPPHIEEIEQFNRPTVADFMNELTEVEDKVSDEGEKKKVKARVTASTATQELDMLMADLSDFKLPPQKQQPPPRNQQQPEQPYAKPQKEPRVKSQITDLDNMLGSLQSNMNRKGVDTSSKGVCAACDKPILGKAINAIGKTWHPEHFTCGQCEMELASVTFYEYNGTPYCEKDYHELFAPRCAYCNGPILDRCMKALDKTWHPEHFFCTLCGKHFGNEGFHSKDSKAYCRECYYEKFAPRCKRCDKSIMEGFITALGAQWHSECFCCKVCGVTFPQGDYYDYNGEPHCELHYHAQRGTLCAQCQKPITGQCVSAMGKKFHPEHFTCAFCLKLLNKGTFKEHRNNAYCQPCYIKLFG
jgi:paxillin